MRLIFRASVLLLALLAAAPAAAQSNLLGTVQSVRAKYGPVPSEAELCAIVNEVAWIHREEGFGLSAKPGGNACVRHDGARVAVDIVQHQSTGTLFDILIDAGGPAIPSWGVAHPHNDPNRPWVAPIAPAGGTPPPPPPPPDDEPPPSDPDLKALLVAMLAKLDALEQAVQAQTEALLALQKGQAEQTVALRDAINELKKQVAAGVKIRF